MFISWNELSEEQKKPLEYKIDMARQIFARAFKVSKYRMAVAWSGGKDSTVLLDFLLRFFPLEWISGRVHVIYGNTGIEYPECVDFWKAVSPSYGDRAHMARPSRLQEPSLRYESQKIVWKWALDTGKMRGLLKPDGKLKSTRHLESLADEVPEGQSLKHWKEGQQKNYWWCVDQYGWPLLGKAFSKLSAHRINIDTFLRFSKSKSSDPKLIAYYKVLEQVKISQACCEFLKKEPSRRAQAELDVDLVFKGLLASESRNRARNFVSRGYLFEGAKQDHLNGSPFFHCQPLAIWNDSDIWEYIYRYRVPYASLYDMGYRDKTGTYHKIKRNGCMGCCTDLLYPNNHMAMLRRTHPKAWRLFMLRGMAREIQNLQRMRRSKGQLALFDTLDPERVLDAMPCWFDSLKKPKIIDDTATELFEPTDPEIDDAM